MRARFLGGDFPLISNVMFGPYVVGYWDVKTGEPLGSFKLGELKRVVLEGKRSTQERYRFNDIRHPLGLLAAVGDALTREEEKHNVTFAAELKDGRKFAARASRFSLQHAREFVSEWFYSDELRGDHNDLWRLLEAASANLRVEKAAKARYERRGIITFWILIAVSLIISAVYHP